MGQFLSIFVLPNVPDFARLHRVGGELSLKFVLSELKDIFLSSGS